MKTRILARLSIVPLAAGLLTLGACDDPLEVEEHLEVEGFAIFEGTTEIYRYLLSDDEVGTLSLPAGAHDVVFVLLGENGLPLEEEEHEGEEEEHVLQITITDASILTWTPEADAGAGAHDFIEFHGVLNALQAGSTTMDVCVPHEGHCDFEAPVPVTVTATM